jgi:CheY-like chemotaxis protein
VRLVIQQALEQAGIRFMRAKNGEEGVMLVTRGTTSTVEGAEDAVDA